MSKLLTLESRVYDCLFYNPDSSAEFIAKIINVPPKWFQNKNCKGDLNEKINSFEPEDSVKVEKVLNKLFKEGSIIQSVPGYPKRYSTHGRVSKDDVYEEYDELELPENMDEEQTLQEIEASKFETAQFDESDSVFQSN